MPRKRSINFIVDLQVYPFEIMFSLGETDEELKKAFKRVKTEPLDYFDHPKNPGRCSLFPGGNQVIRLLEYPTTPYQLGILQHEIFHGVSHVMETIGIPLVNQTSDEAYTYLIAYITEQVYKRIK